MKLKSPKHTSNSHLHHTYFCPHQRNINFFPNHRNLAVYIPTNQSRHTLLQNKQNCQHFTIHSSYLFHLIIQLILHITHLISSLKPPQYKSPSIHPKIPEPHTLQPAYCKQHVITLILNCLQTSTPFPLKLTYIPYDNVHLKSLAMPHSIMQVMPVCPRITG